MRGASCPNIQWHLGLRAGLSCLSCHALRLRHRRSLQSLACGVPTAGLKLLSSENLADLLRMLNRVLTVALNTYREAVRARILLGLAGVALAAAFYSAIVGAFTIEDAQRVTADLGATTVSVFSIVVAVLIGATTLHRELEMKTILPLLARPIRRGEYLVGKFFGIMLVVTVFVFAESGVVLIMCSAIAGASDVAIAGVCMLAVASLLLAAWRWPQARTYGPIPWSVALFLVGAFLCRSSPAELSLIAASSLLTLFEVAVVAAIAMVFGSFSTPFLSSLMTFGSFLVGRSADSLERLPKKFFGEAVHEIAKLVAKVVPNLHVYHPTRPLLVQEAADANLASYLALAGVQALGWTAVLLCLAGWAFQRRDFS